MPGYFEEARVSELLRQYPIGEAFLSGPAAMSRDELHALQDRRLREVGARGWGNGAGASNWWQGAKEQDRDHKNYHLANIGQTSCQSAHGEEGQERDEGEGHVSSVCWHMGEGRR